MRVTLRRILWSAALVLSAGSAVGQTPPPTAQRATESSYIATGPTSEADLARLRAALSKIPGIEQIDLTTKAGKINIRIRGTGGGTLLTVAAKKVGFALRSTPRLSMVATKLSTQVDTIELREALGKVEGVERVEITGPTEGAMVRVLGDVKPLALAEAAKSSGFDLRRISSYVASGPSAKPGLQRLRASLEKVAGVSQMELREVAGGAVLRVQGAMEDEALVTSAKSAGFGLLPLSDIVGGNFRLNKMLDAEGEDKLRNALQQVTDIGEVQIRRSQEGTQLSVKGSKVIPEVIVATAKAAGFYLRPGEAESAAPDAEVEQDTPPSPVDRILDDQTKLGELAPDFTLLTKDGKNKVSLSDSRGKKPVVLIFGSYT